MCLRSGVATFRVADSARASSVPDQLTDCVVDDLGARGNGCENVNANDEAP